MNPRFIWKKLVPTPDPKHGKPCTRSSLGISYIGVNDACPTARLILHGGETVARTPLDSSQATWSCDLTDDDNQSWRLIPSSDPSPPPRVAHAQAYHAPSSSLYVFGGRAGITMQEQAMNDLWKLDCSGPAGSEKWSQVKTDGDTPEARSFHKMICVGDSLYVFGGCGETSGRLADMHRLDLLTHTWHSFGSSQHLRGRGGANLLSLGSGHYLGVVAGFAGEETNDGHLFDVKEGKWRDESLTAFLEGLRPRSVCLSESFPSVGVALIFGGEVDPSAKGHEGAGSFDNSIVLLEESTGKYIDTFPNHGETWPENRGWSDGTGIDNGDGSGRLFFFGGLSGDDANPLRLDDLWALEVSKA
ncbi:galactose oxidase [Nitzschia inconspicua]|uniref:Galactose oxidase n=1 Tax=Nitzschia inconspicua TaxID=303405 RepID=A0A9K3PE80_9STRA|nr:galactose oxidase [Nitzschia inconspicua]